MAKKPKLDATSRPDSPYSEYTRNYRTSENVEDRRGREYDSARNEAALEDFVNSKEFKDKMDSFPPELSRYVKDSSRGR